jgi:UDP-2,3-diacylglucosamine pyrophosphatase LpxH
MVATVLVISDLHLTNGDRATENWGDPQQQAFEGLLAATQPGQPLASDSVELIINGDCFDFLLTPPTLSGRTQTDVNAAHAKWVNILGAHEAWFAALRTFLRVPGRRVTFLIGNHDVELCYPSIRARVRSAINAAPGVVRFCLTQQYQPLPDVVIDHGCQFDPYNTIPTLWANTPRQSTPAQIETSDARGMAIGPTTLPWGSRYFYDIFYAHKRQLRYLDEMIPSLTFLRQSALLCLLAPESVLAAMPTLQALAQDTALFIPPLTTEDVNDPVALFTATLNVAQLISRTVTGESAGDDPATTAQALQILQALGGDRADALRLLLTIGPEGITRTDRGVLAAAEAQLRQAPETRFFILGHTHEEGRWAVAANQWIMNTGTWFPRKVLPRPEAWSPEFAAWAAHPMDVPYPGHDGQRFVAAWLRSEPGAATVGELIAWQGNRFARVADDAMNQW